MFNIICKTMTQGPIPDIVDISGIIKHLKINKNICNFLLCSLSETGVSESLPVGDDPGEAQTRQLQGVPVSRCVTHTGGVVFV